MNNRIKSIHELNNENKNMNGHFTRVAVIETLVVGGGLPFGGMDWGEAGLRPE